MAFWDIISTRLSDFGRVYRRHTIGNPETIDKAHDNQISNEVKIQEILFSKLERRQIEDRLMR